MRRMAIAFVLVVAGLLATGCTQPAGGGGGGSSAAPAPAASQSPAVKPGY